MNYSNNWPSYPYKYEGKDGKCRNQENKKIASRAKASTVRRIKKEEMRAQLQKGPFIADVDGGSDCWEFYESGIVTSASKCSGNTWDDLNHSVTVVGLDESGD